MEDGEISEKFPAVEESINYKLLRNGFVRLSSTVLKRINRYIQKNNVSSSKATNKNSLNLSYVMNTFENAQENAHNDHLRLWAYGDPGNSDDEDNNNGRELKTKK
jgi:hypothetical protein